MLKIIYLNEGNKRLLIKLLPYMFALPIVRTTWTPFSYSVIETNCVKRIPPAIPWPFRLPFELSQRFHISQSQIRHYIRLLSIIHIKPCNQSKCSNQSYFQNILFHLISSFKDDYYLCFNPFVEINFTAEKAKQSVC